VGGPQSNQLKALRAKKKKMVSQKEGILSQDCNTELLPEFPAYWIAV